MANLRRHGSAPFHLELRFQGRKYQRSLRTKDKGEAGRLLATVEQTIQYVERGVLDLPAECSSNDVWRFLLSGGKITPKPTLVERPECPPLAAICREYLDSYVEGAKEASTLKTERLHLGHLQRLLGEDKRLDSLDTTDLERYVRERRGEKGIRGRTVAAATVSKELATFGLLWKFAVRREWAWVKPGSLRAETTWQSEAGIHDLRRD